MSGNIAENRRMGLTPREAIFVNVVRDGLRRAHKAAGRVNRSYRGCLSVQPSLLTTYIRPRADAGKAYDFDAADLEDLPEVYFFIATVPFVASLSGEAIVDVGDTIADMVRSIERVIEREAIVLAIEEQKAARREGAGARVEQPAAVPTSPESSHL